MDARECYIKTMPVVAQENFTAHDEAQIILAMKAYAANVADPLAEVLRVLMERMPDCEAHDPESEYCRCAIFEKLAAYNKLKEGK